MGLILKSADDRPRGVLWLRDHQPIGREARAGGEGEHHLPPSPPAQNSRQPNPKDLFEKGAAGPQLQRFYANRLMRQ